MKKLFAILLVICVASALFASVGTTVKLGASTDLFRVKTPSDEKTIPISRLIKGIGFGVDFAAQYDISEKVMFFSDYNIVFMSDAQIRTDAEETEWTDIRTYFEMPEDAELFLNFWSAAIGVAYKIDLNRIKLALGGGLHFNRFWNKMRTKEGEMTYDRTEADMIFGFTTFIEGKFMLTGDMGITLTAKPQIGLAGQHTTSFAPSSPETKKALGSALTYACPVALGLAYSF